MKRYVLALLTTFSLLVGGVFVSGAAFACSPQDCGTGYNCEVVAPAPDINDAAFYVNGHAKSRCVNGKYDLKVKRQWNHIVLQSCKKIDHWPDKCTDMGFTGAEDASIATAPPKWAHSKVNSECGHHGLKRYYRLRWTQTVEPKNGTGHTFKRNGHGHNSKVKTCGKSV